MSLMLTLVLAVPVITPSPAFPIHPVPLRCLVEHSPFIVVADVVDVVPDERRNVWILRVQRALKGDLSEGEQVTVSSMRGIACPTPARYEPGTTVLAFVSPRAIPPLPADPEAPWVTLGMSYGSKTLDEASRRVYEDRIEELLEILHDPEGSARDARVARWHLACLAHPATRVEALLDLRDGVVGHERRRVGRPVPDWMAWWTDDERRSLVDLLVASDDIARHDALLVQVLEYADLKDDRIAPALAAKARRADDRGGVFFLRELARRLDDPVLEEQVEQILSRRETGGTYEERRERQKQHLRAAIERANRLTGGP